MYEQVKFKEGVFEHRSVDKQVGQSQTGTLVE